MVRQVVPVAGDAAEAGAAEGAVEVVEQQADQVLAQRPGVRKRGHDRAVNEVPRRSGFVRLARDDAEQMRRVLGHRVAAELADQFLRSNAVAVESKVPFMPSVSVPAGRVGWSA